MGAKGEAAENAAPTPTAASGETSFEFLAFRGGPFYDLQKRFALLEDHALRAGPRALIFTALAWLVPLVLSITDPRSYLADPGVWAKFLIAVGAFLLAEQQVECGLRMKLGQFVRAPLIAPHSLPAAGDAVAMALRRRDSALAEAVCLGFGIMLSVVAFTGISPAASWAVDPAPDGPRITPAGWWALFVSLPLFGFLFLRGLWRHLVWALLLRKIATLDLRLVATHPDGNGGLAFLADYPNAYMLSVLGASSAVAAAVAKHLAHETISMTTFTSITGGWLAIVLALFVLPLAAFSSPLVRLKESGVLVCGAQATRFQRATERKALGANVVADSPEERDEKEETSDVSKQFDAFRKLSGVLVNRFAVLPVAAAALLPFAIAGAMKLPFKEVFSVLKKLLLL
ncbi:hypothetical protein [Rhizobium sp. YS-1r]|uniref:hypothetical protein n=1 Tax=Rhizobium sp. YS-1r TaxID=1532558 RepID=UPI00068CEBE7|nr:hypothetical protein [Rhizobium sp. YS-1r]